MQFVEPIRDAKKIAQIKNLLKAEGNIRDLLLFVLGMNSALRISDLLKTRVSDVYKANGEPRESFELHDGKTGKRNVVDLTDTVKEVLILYKQAYPGVVESPHNYVLFSTRSENRGDKPLDRRTTNLIVKKNCERVGLSGYYGNHTLRKTWGYHARKVPVDLSVIQEKLNHSSPTVTRRYLGINKDEVREASLRVNL